MVKIKKVIFLVISLCKFEQRKFGMQLLALKNCNQDISKTITASSFKLRQLIEDNE